MISDMPFSFLLLLPHISYSPLITVPICYISTKLLPGLGEVASMVTDTRYNFYTPNEKGGDCCQ